MRTSRVYSEMLAAYAQGCRYIDSEGGARSTKTYSALQLFITLAIYDRTPTLTSIISETFPHLKRGAMRDFEDIMRREGLWDEEAWNRSDSIYTFASGSRIEFFSADNVGRVHGPARDRLFANEAQNLQWEVARQLFIRTRGLIVIDYNPTHEFWAHKQITPDPRTVHIHSTFRDNPFLTKDQVLDIMAGKKDENWWRVYGLGLVGQLEGVIFDFTQIDGLPENRAGLVHLCGLDYGFANDPTALVDIYADPRRKVAYIDEVVYRKGLFNSDIIDAMRAASLSRAVPVYGDCAEPKANAEIRTKGGFNVIESYKGADINAQIHFVKGWDLRVTKRSTDWIHEARNYCYAKNRDGESLNVPVDRLNHCMDATRYALFTHFGQFKPQAHDGRLRNTKAW